MTIIQPKIRGFVCVTAHPTGCKAHIDEQIAYVQAKGLIKNGPKKVLVIGSSTGYGLSTRIAAAFGSQANTLGVCFERPSENGKCASAGWYNTWAFEEAAHQQGLYAKTINGDAFSKEIKEQVIAKLKKDLGPVDLVIYSLASPRRADPQDGTIYKSTLKPIGENFTAKNLDTDKKLVHPITIEPATQEEIDATIKVMGGEDWELWIKALLEENLLAPGAKTLAYSYIGPDLTWPIYKNGTIGKAKEDLERAASSINKNLQSINGNAYVAVNKAVVTQASSAIPVVPLYISLLFKIMKQNGTHEGCIEQMYRLLATQLYNNHNPKLDEQGRIRMDDLEMQQDIQAQVAHLWLDICTDQIDTATDFAGYQKEFLKLFGFGMNGVDYNQPVSLEKLWTS